MISRGKKKGIALLASLPVFIVTCVWVFLDALQNGETRRAVMAVIGLVYFAALTRLFTPSRKYIPGKTFRFYRNKKLTTKKAINYGYGVTVLVFVMFAVLVPKYMVSAIGYGAISLGGLYAVSKSLKFHADVDFSTNEYLTTALGFSVGEKILVSYQDFDTDDVRAGGKAFAATATKLIVAWFDGAVWSKLSRDLNQISHIGVMSDQHNDCFVKLQFNDGADILLRIGLERSTSSPILVVRRLLETIDASLLPGSDASQTVQRRRVVVDSATPTELSKNVAPEPMAPVRNIELAPDVLNAIQRAEEVAPGRRLEL